MRLRNNPESLDGVYRHPYYVRIPEQFKGKWHEYFKNNYPLQMEIGSGKGKFITTLAQQNKNTNFIALEKFTAVMAKLITKIPEEELHNLALLNADAENLPYFFEPGEIHRFYLNFSDPWPKKRHVKRRLTHSRFLMIYKALLAEDGCIILKTDNCDFFEFSIEQFHKTGYDISDISRDLHNSPYVFDNVTTEYEDRFIRQGFPIYRLTAYKIV